MKRSEMSALQFVMLMLTMPLVAGFSVYAYLVAQVGVQGWWITIAVAVAGTTLLSIPLTQMARANPDYSLVALMRLWFGRIVATLVSLPIVGMSLSGGLLILWLVNQLMSATILPSASMATLTSGSVLVAGFLAFLGPVGMARLNQVVMILIVIPLMPPLYGYAVVNVQGTLLRPWAWWPHGLPLSHDFWALVMLAWSGPLLIMFTPYVHRPRWTTLYGWSGAISFVILLVLTLGPVGVLGPNILRKTPLSELLFFQTSNATILFVEQLGYVMVVLAIPIFWTAAGVCLWVAARAVTDGLGHPSWQPWLVVLWSVVLGVLTATLAVGYSRFFHYLIDWAEAYGVFYLVLLLVFWPLVSWRQRHPQVKA